MTRFPNGVRITVLSESQVEDLHRLSLDGFDPVIGSVDHDGAMVLSDFREDYRIDPDDDNSRVIPAGFYGLFESTYGDRVAVRFHNYDDPHRRPSDRQILAIEGYYRAALEADPEGSIIVPPCPTTSTRRRVVNG